MPAPVWDFYIPPLTLRATFRYPVLSASTAAQRICTSTSVGAFATTSKSAGDSGRNSWFLPVQMPTFDSRAGSSISLENENPSLVGNIHAYVPFQRRLSCELRCPEPTYPLHHDVGKRAESGRS